MASRWFYKEKDGERGPVDSATLKELAQNGVLKPDDLIRKDGSADWRPASEAKGLFSPPTPNSSELQQEPDKTPKRPQSDEVKAAHNITLSVGASVLVGTSAAVCLHAAQWLCGWGLGSLWSVLSSVVILSLGVIPWMLDHEGHKSAAAGFGAWVGVALGVAYGWFTGGLLSGVLFCTSVSTWAAWLAERKGLTTKVAQVGAVAAALSGFYVVGMLSPTATAGQSSATPQDEEWKQMVVRAKALYPGQKVWNADKCLTADPSSPGPGIRPDSTEILELANGWPSLQRHRWKSPSSPTNTFIEVVIRMTRLGSMGEYDMQINALRVVERGKTTHTATP